MAFKVNDVEITSILNTGFKTGRDSQNLIDFATTDNKLIFRVNNVNEVELVENVLQPTTNDGVALGTASLKWSDLFLADGSVINFNNGDVTLTHSSNALTIAGGVLTAALAVGSDAAGDILYSDGTNYVRLAKGDDDQVLTLASGVPSWAAASGGGGNAHDGDTTIADGSGLIVGHSAFDTTMFAAYATPEFQVLGTGVDSGIGAVRYSADAFGPMIGMGKSRHASLAGNTIVVDNDVLGKLIWFGADGTTAATIGAEVFARVNGTPGNGDMPTELVFATTADGASTATERLSIDAAGLSTFAGNVQLGGGDVDTANAYSALVIEKDDHSRLEFLNPVDKVGTIWFSDTTEGMGRIEYSHSTNSLAIRTNATQHMLLDSTGTLFIGDTANAQMTQGLTINQGAADNEAFALKSSDVTHAFISSGYTTPETDTYFQITKQSATLGGTTIASTAEDAAMTGVLTFYSQGGTASTTHSASGVGLVDFLATEHNGAAHLADPSGTAIARANITADGIVYSFRGRVDGANSSLFLIDEDGDTWQKGSMTLGGGQIAFPATQNASSDANTLDDYEEGTWTATYATTEAGISITYASNTGRYTKIGNLVTAYVYINIGSQTTGTGELTVAGIPFPNHASGPYASGTFGQLYQFDVAAGSPGDVMCQLPGGSSVIGLFSNHDDANWVRIMMTAINSTNVGVMMSFTYCTNT